MEDAPPKRRAATILLSEGILENEADDLKAPGDVTRDTQGFPMERAMRLQTLGRADEGFLLALAYSTQRGFGSTHPFVNELKIGKLKVEIEPPELGFPVTVGEIELTECETVNQFLGGDGGPMFTRGYGLVLGNNERKALSTALVERSLRSLELDEPGKGPAQDQEFVLAHGDNVEASGFVSHLKLPHYVDFQAELGLLRDLRRIGRDKPAPADAGAAQARREGESRPEKGAPVTGPAPVPKEGPGAQSKGA
jgi:alpha-D-ribose 1-methylphosphonate 5-triphosphate synthase subunit PhnI